MLRERKQNENSEWPAVETFTLASLLQNLSLHSAFYGVINFEVGGSVLRMDEKILCWATPTASAPMSFDGKKEKQKNIKIASRKRCLQQQQQRRTMAVVPGQLLFYRGYQTRRNRGDFRQNIESIEEMQCFYALLKRAFLG
jgi:hypothetical protein